MRIYFPAPAAALGASPIRGEYTRKRARKELPVRWRRVCPRGGHWLRMKSCYFSLQILNHMVKGVSPHNLFPKHKLKTPFWSNRQTLYLIIRHLWTEHIWFLCLTLFFLQGPLQNHSQLRHETKANVQQCQQQQIYSETILPSVCFF